MKELSCLIVDDDDIQQSLIKELLLSKFHFDLIITAQDGLEAKIKTSNQTFNLIISDINMPKKDGLNFIRESIINKSIKSEQVILISGSLSEKEVKEAMKLKINNILVKPFNTQRLELIVENILKSN